MILKKDKKIYHGTPKAINNLKYLGFEEYKVK